MGQKQIQNNPQNLSLSQAKNLDSQQIKQFWLKAFSQKVQENSQSLGTIELNNLYKFKNIQLDFESVKNQINQNGELLQNNLVAVHLKNFLLEEQRREIQGQFDIFRQNINDFRDGKVLGRGEGRIQDIIDPSLYLPKYH